MRHRDSGAARDEGPWPRLPLEAWKDTYATLHMWTQVIGKIRLAQAPMINHWWQVPLYVTARGLTTSAVPHGDRVFQIDFDFISHRLLIRTGEGATRELELGPKPVSRFYRQVMESLRDLNLPVSIWTMPVEVENPIVFEKDEMHRSYDPGSVSRFLRVLASTDRVFTRFRSRFQGKCSPVHFFWGGFDLAVTRFSGRPAPEHAATPLAPASIVREAYSHEVSSCGFWPGGWKMDGPAFYAYAYPEPAGFKEHSVQSLGGYYHADLGEFILPYDNMRRSENPEETLLGFLQSTYAATADLGGWDRHALEREEGGRRGVRAAQSEPDSGLAALTDSFL
jgi:hypothetical protein